MTPLITIVGAHFEKSIRMNVGDVWMIMTILLFLYCSKTKIEDEVQANKQNVPMHLTTKKVPHVNH